MQAYKLLGLDAGYLDCSLFKTLMVLW